MDTTIILTTLIVFKLILIGVGIWAQSRSKTNEDFFLAGRQLGGFVAAVSYAASSSSAWTLLGMSGITFIMGVSAIWIACGSILGAAIAWYWVAPRMMAYSHKQQILTATEFVAHGSQGKLRTVIISFASAIIIFSFIFYISSQFQGAGSSLNSAFDLSLQKSILLGGVIIILYTLLGGFWAVSITDALQGVLMLLVAILMPIVALWELGGWDAFMSRLAEVSSPEQLSFTRNNMGLLLLGIIFGNMAIGVGTFGQPHLLNRFMALRDTDALKKAQFIAVFWIFVLFLGMFFVGLMGHALIPSIAEPENLLFKLSFELLPALPAAILIAAVLSAIMSTADSMMLVVAASVSHDLNLSKTFPAQSLLISRFCICLIGMLAIALAIYMPASIFQRVLFAWIAIGSAFGPLVFVRLGGIQVKPIGVLLSMAIGFSLAVFLSQFPFSPNNVVERLAPFFIALLVLFWFRQPHSIDQSVPLDNETSSEREG